MAESASNSGGMFRLSIVIAVYDDWGPLEQCLRSLDEQTYAPDFEVIVVDDGSSRPAPECITQRPGKFSFRVIRESHQGIPACRNRGIQASHGESIVFVDADCVLLPDCLTKLAEAVGRWPKLRSFQLNLLGDCKRVVGRAEELRLKSIQESMLRPDGRIRYLNTAGFAVRRAALTAGPDLFDAKSLRAEDTLLLAQLIENDDLPLFVPEARVVHSIPLTVWQCFRKDFECVPLERRAYRIIARKGIAVRMSNQDRFKMLRDCWKLAGSRSIGRAAWLVLVARQALQRLLYLYYDSRPGEFIP